MRSYLSREITDLSRFAQDDTLLCDNMVLHMCGEYIKPIHYQTNQKISPLIKTQNSSK